MKTLVRFIKILFLLVLGVSLSYILTSCKSESLVQPGEVSGNMLPALPQVFRTSADYTPSSLDNAFSNTEIHRRFAQTYGAVYSQSLKESIIGYVSIEVAKMGENKDVFAGCLDAISEFTSSKCLPSHVESARYEGKEAWLFLFNWGMGDEGLGHIAYYAVEKYTNKILCYVTCR